MKKIFVIVFAVAAAWGCSENVNTGFDSDGAVYFQLNTSSWGDARDSLNFSFVGNPGTEARLNLRVMLMGDASERERKVRVNVDRERTTAVEGTHYAALQPEYTIAAGDFHTEIPVTLYRTDDLETAPRVLTLELEASPDLSPGLTARTRARIIFTDQLLKPDDWEDNQGWVFGVWSRVKHEKCLELIGPAFPDNFEDHTHMSNSGSLASRWFENNYPVYDENGNVIEPW